MGDWPVGLSTGCFYRIDIMDCLESIRNSGFSSIEVCSSPHHLDYHDLERVRKAAAKIRELWLDAYSFHAPFSQRIDISSFDRTEREEAVKEIILAAQAAAEIGSRFYVLHPGPETGFAQQEEKLERLKRVVEGLERVISRCEELGLKVVLENQLPHLLSGPIQNLLWILGALKETDVTVCLDTGHAHLSGEMDTVVEKLSGHLRIIHANDNQGHRDDHLPPGKGEISWDHFLRQLDRTGFRGTLILEISGDIERHQVLQGAQEARKNLQEAARRAASSPLAAGGPAKSDSSTR